VPHEFLSDDWMEAVKAIRDKYADQAPPVPYKIRMNQVISGAPFNDGADIHIYMDTSDGTMTLDKGELENPEVTVSTDWTRPGRSSSTRTRPPGCRPSCPARSRSRGT